MGRLTTLCIIQARLGSKRLPGKVLMQIGNKTLLEHVVDRVRRVPNIDGLVVATTDKAEDHNILQHCRRIGVHCMRGNAHDVLDRYYWVAKILKADHILRVTADCPVWDVESGTAVVQSYLSGSYEYISNVTTDEDLAERGISTDGWDAEVFSFDALERAWSDWTSPYSREHVSSTIRLRPHLFKVGRVLPKTIPGGIKLSVDSMEDLIRVRAWYSKQMKEAA